jgi:alpha-tubulin suppressor-like RCC1 family protein
VSGQLGRRADGGEPAMIDADVLVGRINNLDLGKEHSCAIVEGTIFCWGANGSGQLGSVGVTRSNTPLQIPAISGATSVGTGEEHTCAIAAQGAVYCWGSNLEGQVGLTLSNIGDDFHEINLPYGASAKLAVGDNFTCATDEEHIYCWGSNEFAQLGTNPVDLPSSPSPRKIALGSGICERAGLIGSDTQAKCVTQIAAGRAHACFIDVGGRVYCWGRLSTGAESFQTQPTPRLVPGLSGSIRSISCGDGFTCAINTENRLQCWGNTAFGKLGRADFNSSGPGEVEFWQ